MQIKGKDFKVNTSKEYLSIILKVLIENAIKYSKDIKKIDIELNPLQKKLIIKDYGIGIEEEKLKKTSLRDSIKLTLQGLKRDMV